MSEPEARGDLAPVGVVGLGLMGTAICERLLAAGYPVVVFNRTRDKAQPFIERGARWSDNPLRDCKRTIISLFNTEIVEQVLQQLEAGLTAGSILIDTTTGDPQRMEDLGSWLARRGVTYLEAPISGSSEQTRRHLATAIVAGPREAYADCQDLFACLARQTYFVGRWGNGVRMKLVTNVVLGLNRAVLAEGLVFAESVGLSSKDALEVLMNSPAYSRTMDAKGPKMVTGNFEPQAKLAQHVKDVRLILDEASRGGKALPLSQTHLELLQRSVEEGLGELDNSAIIRTIADCLVDEPIASR